MAVGPAVSILIRVLLGYGALSVLASAAAVVWLICRAHAEARQDGRLDAAMQAFEDQLSEEHDL
jgi:hypothetical protein